MIDHNNNNKLDPPGVTLSKLNWAMFAAGMVIIWFSSHNWVAMLGGFVASMHIRVLLIEEGDNKNNDK